MAEKICLRHFGIILKTRQTHFNVWRGEYIYELVNTWYLMTSARIIFKVIYLLILVSLLAPLIVLSASKANNVSTILRFACVRHSIATIISTLQVRNTTKLSYIASLLGGTCTSLNSKRHLSDYSTRFRLHYMNTSKQFNYSQRCTYHS